MADLLLYCSVWSDNTRSETDQKFLNKIVESARVHPVIKNHKSYFRDSFANVTDVCRIAVFLQDRSHRRFLLFHSPQWTHKPVVRLSSPCVGLTPGMSWKCLILKNVGKSVAHVVREEIKAAQETEETKRRWRYYIKSPRLIQTLLLVWVEVFWPIWGKPKCSLLLELL